MIQTVQPVVFQINLKMFHPAPLFSAIRGLSTYQIDLSTTSKLILVRNEEFSSANKCYSVEVKKEENGESVLVGHVAKEVSRFVYKWMSKAGAVEVKVYDSFLGNKNEKQKSFRAFGLEIGCVLIFDAEDAEHQNLLRRHFLRMKHKRDMCQKLIGNYSGEVKNEKNRVYLFDLYFTGHYVPSLTFRKVALNAHISQLLGYALSERDVPEEMKKEFEMYCL